MSSNKTFKEYTLAKPPIPYEVVQTFKPVAEWFKYMPQAEVDKLPVDVLTAFDTLCAYTGVKLPREITE